MTGAEIAECLGMAMSTVSGILTRIGLGKLSRLEPPEPPNRYQREHPGELIHIDVKKLGRIGEHGAGHRATATAGKGSALAARVGSSCTSASTTLPAWPTSRCSQTRSHHRDRLPHMRRGVLPRPWHHRSAADDRQRLCLPLGAARDRVPGSKARALAHPSVPAPNQRQSRALHQDATRWLGLRRDLRSSTDVCSGDGRHGRSGWGWRASRARAVRSCADHWCLAHQLARDSVGWSERQSWELKPRAMTRGEHSTFTTLGRDIRSPAQLVVLC
jgi:hypothetical protein